MRRARSAIREALAQQSALLLTPSPAFHNAPARALAELLCQQSCFDQVYFTNGGAEANEGAIKLARKWGQLHRGGAHEIITFDGAFHGRTLATMSASGKPGWDRLYAPQVPGFPKARLNDIDSVRALIGPATVAVMLEPVQGESGVHPATAEFMLDLRALCDRAGLLQRLMTVRRQRCAKASDMHRVVVQLLHQRAPDVDIAGLVALGLHAVAVARIEAHADVAPRSAGQVGVENIRAWPTAGSGSRDRVGRR